MGFIIVVVCVIVIGVIFCKISKRFKQYKAALNCLMAKAKFAEANDDLKTAAVFRSWRMLEKMGFSDPQEDYEKLPENVRFSRSPSER